MFMRYSISRERLNGFECNLHQIDRHKVRSSTVIVLYLQKTLAGQILYTRLWGTWPKCVFVPMGWANFFEQISLLLKATPIWKDSTASYQGGYPSHRDDSHRASAMCMSLAGTHMVFCSNHDLVKPLISIYIRGMNPLRRLSWGACDNYLRLYNRVFESRSK